MTRSRESAVVVTVAVRGVRAISAISPKKSPRLSVRTLRPLRCTSASPSMRTKNSRPSAPSRMSSLPGAEVDLIGELRDLREFLLRAAREQWEALDRLNLRVTRERHDASHQSVGYSRRRSTIANDRQRLQRIRPDANPAGDLSISSPVDSPARAIAKHVLLGRRERSLTCSSLVAYAKRLAPHLAQLHVLPVSRRPSAFDWVSGRWLRPRRRCRIAGKQRIAESGTCIQDVAS